MRVNQLLIAGLLVAGLLGALPSSAVETATAAPAPLADTGLFTPAPVNRVGTHNGPCTVSVTCRIGTTLTCTGQGSCQWKGDGIPSFPGYVQCDGFRTSCPPI